MEDDYCVSPSEAAFMYDREGSKNKQKMGAFFQTVNDIAEENEGELESKVFLKIEHLTYINTLFLKEASLSEIDRLRLESCIGQIKQTVGLSVPRQDLVDIILLYNFNVEKAINFILDNPQYKDVKSQEKREKGV